MLLNRRRILRGAAFLCLFVGLTYPWPRLGYLFTVAFSSVTNVGLQTCFRAPEFRLHFAAAEPRVAEEQSAGEWNVVLFIESPAGAPIAKLPLGVRRIAYIPLATFASLTLVTPLALRRKLVVAGAGLTLLLFRIVLAVTLPLARHFGAIVNDSFLDWVSRITYYALIEPPNLMIAAPILIWAVLLLVTAPEGSAWLSSFSSRQASQTRQTRQTRQTP
jgi:hypothetical protein